MTLRGLIKRGLRSAGFDLTRYPLPEWFTLREHLVTLFGALKINCVLDVGAHHGEYTEFLRQIGYSGPIVSFEPVAASFARLQQRCSGDVKWTGYCVALGRQNMSASINVTHGSNFSSFLSPNVFCSNQFGSLSKVVRTETVDVKRLDGMFRECVAGIADAQVYLKIDTQGYEFEVLEGAGSCLDHVSALQIELSVKPIYSGAMLYTEALSRLNGIGFEITGLFPVTHDERLRVIEFDCVMVRSAPPSSTRQELDSQTHTTAVPRQNGSRGRAAGHPKGVAPPDRAGHGT